jgi:hypothetical protein
MGTLSVGRERKWELSGNWGDQKRGEGSLVK